MTSDPTPAATLYSERSRSARTTLLCGIAGFLTLQIGLAFGIEGWLPEFRHPSYAAKARRLRQRMREASIRPLTITMVGSSRTTFGFSPAGVEADLSRAAGRPVVVFNFGLLGAGPVTELLVLRRLLSDGIHPDRLLGEVMPAFLTDQPEMFEANRMPVTVDCLRREELAVWNRYGAQSKGLAGDWWLDWPVPCYSHRFSIMSKLAAGWLPYGVRQDQFRGIDASGWVNLLPRDLTPEEHTERAASERRTCAPCLEHFHLDALLCQAVRELLELCRQKHIAVTLVLMPESTGFRALYSSQGQQDLQAFLDGLLHSFDVGLVDARDWMTDDQFIDSDHLHAAGARRFTERLGRECLFSLIAPNPQPLEKLP